ncbi:hypothetical protein BYT27DRAFT_7258537 [Phlegmacium glaucopus]|nr:hypothetical protein BYT27DRAFT_7258537 [Phlegmacium glaucopus]
MKQNERLIDLKVASHDSRNGLRTSQTDVQYAEKPEASYEETLIQLANADFESND